MTAPIFWLTLVLAVPALVLLLDWALYSLAGNDATLSRLFLRVESRWLLFGLCVAFDFGVLVGHLFLPQTVAVNP